VVAEPVLRPPLAWDEHLSTVFAEQRRDEAKVLDDVFHAWNYTDVSRLTEPSAFHGNTDGSVTPWTSSNASEQKSTLYNPDLGEATASAPAAAASGTEEASGSAAAATPPTCGTGGRPIPSTPNNDVRTSPAVTRTSTSGEGSSSSSRASTADQPTPKCTTRTTTGRSTSPGSAAAATSPGTPRVLTDPLDVKSVLDLRYSPHQPRDSHGRFASTGSGSGGGWKPKMSVGEADAWAKDSAHPGPVFRISRAENAEAIAKEGFSLERSNFGSVFGKGVYVTPADAATGAMGFYGHGGDRVQMEMRVKIKNPIRVEAVGEGVPEAFLVNGHRVRYSGPIKELVAGAAGFGNEYDDRKAGYDVINERIMADAADARGPVARPNLYVEALKRGYDPDSDSRAFRDAAKSAGFDSVIVTEKGFSFDVGGSQIVVFDPDNVTVVHTDTYYKATVVGDPLGVAWLTDEKYNPAQARRPAGSPQGGQFAPSGGGSSAVPINAAWGAQAEKVREFLGTVPKDPAERKKVEANMKRVLADADVYIRADESTLTQIIESGAVLNQFQTGTSNGYIHSPNASFDDPRKVLEHNQFGIDEDAPGEKRPVYGYVANDPFDSHYGSGGLSQVSLDQYGTFAIKLKPDVKKRSSFTEDDSLDTNKLVPTTAASPMTEPSVLSTKHYASWEKADTVEDVLHDNAWTPFVEAQVHGGVKLSDIAAVYVPEHMLGDIQGSRSDWEDMAAFLNSNGIGLEVR
jgi:hypothetical protein